ncbi:hypothetical protein TWF694_011337 [Orbilia ellipsospora]|uniref:Alpha/beta hydrolase fold-3 domain-containing protein n=1 Tax=Orbilia ellipsospora TaxID=2528407 RepID=A0AAV9X626_9PEZI
MRLPRPLLTTVSRARILSPIGIRVYSSSRLQSTKARQVYPSRFHERSRPFYGSDYLEFYQKRIAGKARYDIFEENSLQYPCAKDYRRTSPVAENVSCEDVILPRKATGSICLRIYKSQGTDSKSPVIIYLPSRGTNPIRNTDEHHVISHLTRITRATTIAVGYRISPPFPLALQDALAAVDWARDNIPAVSLERFSEDYSGRLMVVLGTGLGGSLATSIGITEGRESGIIAAGAWMPVTDWAFDPLPGIPESNLSNLPKSPSSILNRLLEFEDDPTNPQISISSLAEVPDSQLEPLGVTQDILSSLSDIADNPFLSSENLKNLRSRYLATPEEFTDPFVSPLYWFSSTGVNIWTELLAQIEQERLADPENPPAWIDTLPDDLFKRGLRRGKSYPPLNLIGKLTVPQLRIVSAEGDILHQQTKDFVNAAKASMFPKKRKTLEELEKEESDELELRFNNDKLEVNNSQRPMAEVVQAAFQASQTAEEPKPEDEPAFSEHAAFYIHHEVVKKAGHCLITAATEISDAMKEVDRMGAWISQVFNVEPTRTRFWKKQKDLQEEERQRLLLEKRSRNSSKL